MSFPTDSQIDAMQLRLSNLATRAHVRGDAETYTTAEDAVVMLDQIQTAIGALPPDVMPPGDTAPTADAEKGEGEGDEGEDK